MPMMAIMAKRPLASSALNFLDFSAGSLDVRTFQPYPPWDASLVVIEAEGALNDPSEENNFAPTPSSALC